MEETIGKASLRDASIGTGIAVDKMLALTGQSPVGIQIANVRMPSPEEREEIDRRHRALDEITRLFHEQEPLSVKEELTGESAALRFEKQAPRDRITSGLERFSAAVIRPRSFDLSSGVPARNVARSSEVAQGMSWPWLLPNTWQIDCHFVCFDAFRCTSGKLCILIGKTPFERDWVGRDPNPGTNPESFRGCSVKSRTARLKLRVADSSSVLDCARSCVLRPLMELPAPRQVQFGLQTDALCGCRRAYARPSGVQDCR